MKKVWGIMLNYIWAVMIIIAVIYGGITGNMAAVGDGAIASAKEAVELCVTMIGVMSMWMGIMEVANGAGIVQKAEKMMAPAIRWMFPKLPENHEAGKHITTNMVANILGLGWAATPPGLRAMEELGKLQQERMDRGEIPRSLKGVASDEMCTFLVINISSLQLIPVNIIAYRSQYGAVSPTAIVAPAIVATTIGTLVGFLYCKYKCRS